MKAVSLSDTYLGLDLGGTKLLIGEMDALGNIIRSKKYLSGYLNQQGALDLLNASLDDYFSDFGKPDCRAMGLGIIGRVDSKRGVWEQIDSGRNAGGVRIAEILSAKYGIPCYADNDARSASRAEAKFGYGIQTKDFIYINIGTGIASGIISDGHILTGAHFNAGETGHTSVNVDAGVHIACECGRTNCAEILASGLGIDLCARALQKDYPGTSLAIPDGGARVSVHDVFEKSDADLLCRRLTDTAVKAVSELIMNLVRVSDPEMVVLGGGIISDGFLYKKIVSYLNMDRNKNTMRFVTGGVVMTKFNPDFAGLIGACTVAMKVEDLC